MVAATTYTYALVMPELRTSLPCGLDAEHTDAQDETGHKREAATSAVAGRHRLTCADRHCPLCRHGGAVALVERVRNHQICMTRGIGG